RLYIEGKNLSFTAEAEGKEFAPSNLKEQLNLVTLKKESTAPSCAVAEPSEHWRGCLRKRREKIFTGNVP
ncbi:hypothetical protein, partial [Aminobacterium colombiense]|uniref:hypothetical protein n=1 Tax=Aminobacterium colombiense TaxID=81468 RepID=UPI0025924FD9